MIDLKPFCWHDESRLALMHPWEADGMVLASDGHILVAVQPDHVAPYEQAPASADHPDHATILGPPHARAEWFVPLADCYERQEVKSIPCPDCEGTLKPVCAECEGRGTIRQHEQCDVCGGLGKFPECARCDNTGVEHEDIWVPLPPGIFKAQYLNMLLDLPNARFGVSREHDPVAPLPFVFEGGKGVLMPIREKFGPLPKQAREMHERFVRGMTR